MDTPRTPRTPRDNLRTGPGDLLEELEDTPLLPRYSASPPGDTPPGEVPPGDAAQGKGPSFEAAWSEGKRICGIGAPMIGEEVAYYASTIISVAMAGRLGGFALGAFSLSHAVTNITGIALLNGVTAAVDTFGSQARGARVFSAVGIALQRALLLASLTCLPLLALYWWIEPVLLLLGQEARLAAAAARYTRLYSPKIPLHALSLVLFRVLASQGAATYILAAGALLLAVTAPLNYLFIWTLGWGLDGSALAAVACEAIYAAALVAACVLHNRRRPAAERWWHGWSGEALRNWGPFLWLSAAATAMTLLDWMAYDILTLLAGLLPSPDTPVAATGIAYNIQSLIYMLPFGLSYAVCARVGRHLGASRPAGAKLAAEVGTGLGLLLAGLPATALLLTHERAFTLFTTEAAVVGTCAALVHPLCILIITNGATALLSGILRGSGRQKVGAVVNGVSNYAVGLPLQLLLAFRLGHGVAGLWWGIAAAATLQAAVLAVLVSRFDWNRETARSARLVRHLSQSSVGSARAQQAAAAAGTPPSGDLAVPLLL